MYKQEDIDLVERYINGVHDVTFKLEGKYKIIYDDTLFWRTKGYIDISNIPVKN